MKYTQKKGPIVGKSLSKLTTQKNKTSLVTRKAEEAEMVRPVPKGKFFYVRKKKYWIKGVTYGTFQPDENGHQFPPLETVYKDFAAMRLNNINTVRVYTPPPLWLMDMAQVFGLRLMIGLPWEQHITFLDSKKVVQNIKDRIRRIVRSCKNHPTIFCYTLGNEIPSDIVRWYGPRKVEKFLKELYDLVKEEDPGCLVTYVNFPPTEYLQLPFLDFYCFNVYLENQESLDGYLARLQNLAGERPLVMAELGLDSHRNGEKKQAEILDWQISTAFKKGAAGIFIYAWTDEWHRGGHDILDWDFGITDRDRKPKKALKKVRKAFSRNILSYYHEWPLVSVVVCTLNGASTLRECLDSLSSLNYPNYEVILVSDGSTDDTVSIAQEYDCKIIATENRGLSSARNTAWQAAAGEIVGYIDDDAYADPDWLCYLAISFLETDFSAVGGPNIPPPGDGTIATCVAHAPGGPTHVLLSDEEAEHIPGCNMAFRRKALEEIGGFDPVYRAAGDDVDICWRIMEKGWKIGFNPAAVVWHHRRNEISTYWKQQKGYGKAEALLETKWPEKFNFAGHLSWGGRLYSPGMIRPIQYRRSKIEYGTWGTGFFQSLYGKDPNRMNAIPLLPEWYILVAALLVVSCLGFIWDPLLYVFPVAILAIVIIFAQAIDSTMLVYINSNEDEASTNPVKLKLMTTWLFLIQPMARLSGRLECGLTMWRKRHKGGLALPFKTYAQIWNESWKSKETLLNNLETLLNESKVQVVRGGVFDAWDLEVREGMSTPMRILMGIEEHGGGKQLIRFRMWPRYTAVNTLPFIFFLGVSIFAFLDEAWLVALILLMITGVFGYFFFQQCLPVIRFSIQELAENDAKTEEVLANGK